MKLYLKNHTERFALEQLQMQLFPNEKMEFCTTPFRDESGAVSALSSGKTYLTATAKITLGGNSARAMRRIRLSDATPKLRRRILQQVYYLAAVKLLGAAPPWGALSGVRPSKLSTACLLSGQTRAQADRYLENTFFITPDRRTLCLDASAYTLRALSQLRERDLSLYVGIPFCPTRCAYCSFVSQSVERFSHLLPPYLAALEREIVHTGALLRASGYHIRTLYIGGGTPTTLSAGQLSRLLFLLSAHFDLSQCLEITVEGGRPDTLDLEKLQAIRAGGGNRMSINPQTMSDEVLKRVGRRHTAAQTLRAYEAAVTAGFSEINMDLIAGLPDDTVDGFTASLDAVMRLHPTNITVHTLSLKKGTELFFERQALPSGGEVAQMLDHTAHALRGACYEPYYLYRQKYMSGSFENVGWCKPGHAGLYNIIMMEELHTVLALGSGGMTKILLAPGKLARFHNDKYPAEYIRKIDEILAQKDRAFDVLLGGSE